MEKVSIIGLDLAKSIIQVHAASVDGSVLFRRKVSSKKLLAFLSGFDPCIVVMEACGGQPPLGSRDWQAWSSGQADRANLRQTVRQASEE
jgi:hypothetical protein